MAAWTWCSTPRERHLSTGGVHGHAVRVEPLDKLQQHEFELARAARAPWMKSRRGLAAWGFVLGGLTTGAMVAGWVAAGGAWPIPVLVALVVTVCIAVYLGRQDPDAVLAMVIRSQHPSAEAYRRGVSAFQLAGGRVPKPGEKPSPPYWRTK